MAKKPLQKVTIRLYDGDKDELDEMYPDLGHNKVIRTLVHNFIKKVQEDLNKTYQPAKPSNVDITIEEA